MTDEFHVCGPRLLEFVKETDKPCTHCWTRIGVVSIGSEQRYGMILDAPVRSPTDLCKVPVVMKTSRLFIIVTDHSICLATRCRPRARLEVSDRFDFISTRGYVFLYVIQQ